MFEHPNAALVERLYAAFESNDAAALAKLIAEDAVWLVPGTTPISGEHRGHQAIFAYFQKIWELSDGTFRAELIDVLASDMHAAALASATGKREDRAYDETYLLLFRIDKDRIVEARLFNENDDAFNAFWS